MDKTCNCANETSRHAIQTHDDGGRWLSSFALDRLAAAAGDCFERIGCDFLQRVNAEFVTRRIAFRKPIPVAAGGGRLG